MIKNTHVQKIRLFFVFMEWLHLPHGKVILREYRTSHDKVLTELYGNSHFNFLINFNLVS